MNNEEIKYHFFLNGKLSNWYPSEFILRSIKFTCIEQCMMYNKAMVFGDIDTAQKILSENNPAKQKELGRQVKHYKDSLWVSIRYNIVRNAIYAKFKQNKDLEEYLKSLKGYNIVEASSEDRVWGIGFEEDDALENIDNWGQNLLGKILTDLANEL